MTRVRVPVASLALLCASCSSSTELPPPVDWLQGGTEEPAPIVPGQYPVDLQGILKLAGSRPLAIEAARARADAAAAAEDEAVAKWLPELRPRAVFNRIEGNVQATAGNFLDVDKQNAFAGVGVELGFNIADAWYSSLAAAQRAQAARLGVRAAQHVNIGAAVRLYYDLVQAAASLRIAEQARLHARELVQFETARVEQGVALRADLMSAQAYFAATEGRQAELEADVQGRRAELTALLVLPESVELSAAEGAIAPIRSPKPSSRWSSCTNAPGATDPTCRLRDTERARSASRSRAPRTIGSYRS